MKSRVESKKVRRPWLLLVCMLFVQGCGLGWLYMKIGDSKRIAGLKLLSYDTRESRFEMAQKNFKTAIGYYDDSILYDTITNPDVFHKKGFTWMMMVPSTRRDAEKFRRYAKKSFLTGLTNLRAQYDRAKSNRTSEMLRLENEVRQELQITEKIDGATETTDEEIEGEDDVLYDFSDANYARNHAGLGQVAFLEAISDRKETSYKVALFHFKLAERSAVKRRKNGKRSFMAKVFDFFNLEEISQDVPYIVEVAKVHNFMALSYRRQGKAKLESDHFGMSRDALVQAKNDFSNDTRVYSEDARLAFYQRDYPKALSSIKKVLNDTDFYADKREFLLLQGQIYNEMKEADQALQSFQWILDREPEAMEAMLGRGMAFAIRKDRNSALADIGAVKKDAAKDPYLLRRLAEIYLVMGDRFPAAKLLLDAFYIDKEDIELVFRLGKLKFEMNEPNEARDLMNKVIQINSTSEYATQAREILNQLGGGR